MYELLLMVAAPIAIGRFAEADRGEGLKWGAITFGLCLLSLVIPLPFIRGMLACGLSLLLMTITKKNCW